MQREQLEFDDVLIIHEAPDICASSCSLEVEKLWALRLLVNMGGAARLCERFGLSDREALLELVELAPSEVDEADIDELFALLNRQLLSLEENQPNLSGPIATNTEMLCDDW